MQKWFYTTLGDEFKIVMGQSPSSEYYNDRGNGLPFFQGKKEFGELYPKIEVWTTQATKRADEGDVLLSVRAPIGDVNIAPQDCGIGRGLAAIKPNDKTCSKFIMYLLKAKENELKKRGAGVTFSAITKPNLFSLPIRLPLEKQERNKIVQVLEVQFARLDVAMKSLRVVKDKLNLYRKSVLKAAFSNELIPQKGCWQCFKIKDISNKIQYGLTSKSGRNYSGPRYLRITDIQNRRVNWETVPFAKEKDNLEEYRLNKSDVVFARTGATVGKSFLIDECPRNAVFASYLIRIVPNQEKIDPTLLWFYFQSPMYWHKISESQRGIGQPNVNGTILSELNIDLPIVIKEQRILMEEIKSRLSVIDKVEEVIDCNLAKAEKLCKSILKSAFEGNLVN